ncbi:MAG: PqqD family protein [Pseudomonadota bacterium]
MDCDIGGERALLDTQSNTYFTLNATASQLWLALAKPQTLDQLVTVITEKFDISAADCRADTELLLQDMIDSKIVQTSQR